MPVNRPDDYLEMPDYKRRQLRLQKKIRHYEKHDRPELSPEDLLKYLRDHKIRSSKVLEKTRAPTDPNTNDFRKAFGSWSEAVRKAFGSGIAFDVDKDYILKSVPQFNLWSVKRFREARKVDPVSVPSWRSIRKNWGTYKNLIECARRQNLKLLLYEYLKLKRKLGHIPSLEELREANIRMDEAILFYGSKKQMDEFVVTMEG